MQEKRRKQMALSATKSNKDNDNNNDNDSSINSSIGKGTGKDHGKGGVDHSKHKKAGGSLYRGESTVVGRGKMKVNEDLQREQSYMNALNVSLAHSDLLIKPKPRYDHNTSAWNCTDMHLCVNVSTLPKSFVCEGMCMCILYV